MSDGLAAKTARPEPGRQELLQENPVLVLVRRLRYDAGRPRQVAPGRSVREPWFCARTCPVRGGEPRPDPERLAWQLSRWRASWAQLQRREPGQDHLGRRPERCSLCLGGQHVAGSLSLSPSAWRLPVKAGVKPKSCSLLPW